MRKISESWKIISLWKSLVTFQLNFFFLPRFFWQLFLGSRPVLGGSHLMLSLSISYPYLIEFHDFADNIQEGMKHQVGGATQAQQGMTFQITLIFTLYFLPWESDHSQNVKTDPVLKLTVRWELERFSLGGSHLQWEPPIRFSWQLTFSVLTVRFSLRTGMKTGVGFSANGWEPPNTGLDF